MRKLEELLFRGKALNNGEEVVGRLIYYPLRSDEGQEWCCRIENGVYREFGTEICVTAKEFQAKYPIDENSGCTDVDPATVGQYSGTKDKNGKMIFEGDIVDGLFQFGLPFSAICAFKNGSFGLKWKHGGGMSFQPFACFYNVNFEVIGNVWDNPELMGTA